MRRKLLTLRWPRLLLVALALEAAALALWVRPCYNPLRLSRASWYAWAAPQLFRYCLVPKGASEATIRRLLGRPPEYIFAKDDAGWFEYLRKRRPPGSDAPPGFAGERVLIYDEGSGIDWIPVYYFIGRDGKLVSVFIGEA